MTDFVIIMGILAGLCIAYGGLPLVKWLGDCMKPQQ